MTRQERDGRYRRLCARLAAIAAASAIVAAGSLSGASPATLNGSTDGRQHTCGYVTADGVTEHLDAYRARCGEQVDQ